MPTLTASQFAAVVASHAMWLSDDPTGFRANLYRASLAEDNLRASLAAASLTAASLRGANLSRDDIR
jgi:uncharacterized protein YjbI with pentapeptide repeats